MADSTEELSPDMANTLREALSVVRDEVLPATSFEDLLDTVDAEPPTRIEEIDADRPEDKRFAAWWVGGAVAAVAASLVLLVVLNWTNNNDDNGKDGVVTSTPEEDPVPTVPRDLSTTVSEATTVVGVAISDNTPFGEVGIEAARDADQYDRMLADLRFRGDRAEVDLDGQIIVGLFQPGSGAGPGPSCESNDFVDFQETEPGVLTARFEEPDFSNECPSIGFTWATLLAIDRTSIGEGFTIRIPPYEPNNYPEARLEITPEAVETATQSEDQWSWLDFGTEAPTPTVPEGCCWQTLEYGPHRFSVPAQWTAPLGETCARGAPGIVLTGELSGSCNPPDTPDSIVRIDEADSFTATGPQSTAVLASLTDPGRVRVLQDGPVADTSDWVTHAHAGIEFSVPPDWPVVNLAESFNSTTTAGGGRSTNGQLPPGTCGRPMVDQVFLGDNPLVPSCPAPLQRDLTPADGIWVHTLGPDRDINGPTISSGTVGDMPVAIIERSGLTSAEPLTLIFDTGESRTVVSLGVGLDTSIGRAVLRSITRPRPLNEPTEETTSNPDRSVSSPLEYWTPDLDGDGTADRVEVDAAELRLFISIGSDLVRLTDIDGDPLSWKLGERESFSCDPDGLRTVSISDAGEGLGRHTAKLEIEDQIGRWQFEPSFYLLPNPTLPTMGEDCPTG